ncbi:MAG: hypothetical protein ACFFB5_14815 [Promethearchaeota archaeon]
MALKNDLVTSHNLILSFILLSSIYMIVFDWRIIIFAIIIVSIFGGYLAFISVGFMDLDYRTKNEKKNLEE